MTSILTGSKSLNVSFMNPELRDIQTRLGSTDSEVRRVALLDIADFEGNADYLPLIIASLKDPVATVRAQAAKTLEEALEVSEDDAGIQALIAILDDSDPLVREAAARSLGDLKQQESARSILPHLVHPKAFVRAALFHALRGLRVTESFTPALAALSDEDAAVRREAVAVLGYLKQPRALPELTALAAGDPAAEVRRAAIGAMGFASGDTVLPALLSGLCDPVWQVREEAAATLAKLRLKHAVGALITALEDTYWQVRLCAARALGRLGDSQAIPALIRTLGHQISNLRKEAALALGEIGVPEALPALERVQNDPDPDVRKSARLAIAQIQTISRENPAQAHDEKRSGL